MKKGGHPIGIGTEDIQNGHQNCASRAGPDESGLQNSDRYETSRTACSLAGDEAAPIFARFYIGTSRQPRVDRLTTSWNQ